MNKHLRKHLTYYLVVLVTQGLGLLAIALNNGQRTLQVLFLVLMASFYILWGVIHHYIHHDLHPKVVLEYVLMGVLAITVVYFLL